eukprot:GFUD01039680.1.p1 GENE.GFUD01039680.1~~GFUD01039680.1.p1  ORF type:complete len:402 (+),score=72.21 GFUD01039680.1:73-1278(+)
MEPRTIQEDFVNIKDEFLGHSKDLFCIPNHYMDSISSVLIPHGVIQERIKKIARDILKDVLKENEKTNDPTANICLNDSLFTNQEETEAIMDLVNDEKSTFTDLMNMAADDVYDNLSTNYLQKSKDTWKSPYPDEIQYIDSFSPGMEMDPLASSSDFSSYNLDLHSILDDHEYPKIQMDRPSIFSSVGNVPASAITINFSDVYNTESIDVSPRQSTIGVKSFATVKPKKESVHFLCILKAQTPFVEILKKLNCPSAKGGYKFFLDLLDHVNRLNSSRSKTSIQVALDFIKVDSCGNSVTIDGIDDLNVVKDSNIVIVEDIVDTGKTMAKLVAKLHEYSPKKILIACLLRKRSRVQCYRPDYTGFEVPNKFLVGYALDFNEYFRDLMHICILSKHGLEKYKN